MFQHQGFYYAIPRAGQPIYRSADGFTNFVEGPSFFPPGHRHLAVKLKKTHTRTTHTHTHTDNTTTTSVNGEEQYLGVDEKNKNGKTKQQQNAYYLESLTMATRSILSARVLGMPQSDCSISPWIFLEIGRSGR